MFVSSETTISLESLKAGFALLAEVPGLKAEIAELRAELAALRAKPRTVVKKWYSLQEAADALQMSERKVRDLVKSGQLTKSLVTRHIKIPAEEIENFASRVTLRR